MENRTQQIARNQGIQRHAAFDEGPQTDFTLHDDQSAGFVLNQLLHREDDLVHYLAAFELPPESQPANASDAGQQPADFGLKHNDQSDGGIRSQGRQHRTEQI